MASGDDQRNKVGSAFNLLDKSMRIVKNNWELFAIVNIFALIGGAVSGLKLDNKSSGGNNFALSDIGGLEGAQLGLFIGGGVIVLLMLMAAGIFLYAMATALELKAAQGKKPTLKEIINDGKKYWLRLFGLNVVSVLMIIGGLILLIVPGIIIFGRIIMSSYFMIDKDLGIKESLSQSNAVTKKYTWEVWGAIGVMVIITVATGFIGIIPWVGALIGAILAIAYSLVLVLRYLQLKNLPGAPKSESAA